MNTIVLVQVFGDGSLQYPAYATRPMVYLYNGIIEVGYYNRNNFLSGNSWVKPLSLGPDPRVQLQHWIASENPALLLKKHPLLLLLPKQFEQFLSPIPVNQP